MAVFVGLPFLAPAADGGRRDRAGRLIYTLYAPTCHQLPERSFFLFGPQITHRVTDLEHAHVLPAGLSILQRQALRLIGNPETGYKVAICERDVAIYGSDLAQRVAVRAAARIVYAGPTAASPSCRSGSSGCCWSRCRWTA